MADDKGYDKARGLAEDALKKTVEGDDASAEKLAEEAKATNQQAVDDVLQELDEDAGSEHDPQRSRKISVPTRVSSRPFPAYLDDEQWVIGFVRGAPMRIGKA